MRKRYGFLPIRFHAEKHSSGSLVRCELAFTALILAAVMAAAFPENGFAGNTRTVIASGKVELQTSDLKEDGQWEKLGGLLFCSGGEENGITTEAKVQIGNWDYNANARLLSGRLLADELQKQREKKEQIRRQEDEQRKKEQERILQERAKKAAEEEAAAQKAAEEAAKKAEEEARAKAEEEKKAARKIHCTEEDYQALLKIVQAEAGGCDEKGKILVANVVMNRVRSDEFPDSIRDVVYEPAQFQPVSTGSINSVHVSDETVRCVDKALAGEDYSQGALYFMNRKGSGSSASWFDRNLDFLFAHDGHEFFK